MQTLSDILTELKHRRVFRVAAVYAGVAFVIIQIIDGAFEYLLIPEWVGTTIIVLLALGFPIAVGLAWAFDLTKEGMVRAKPKRETTRPRALSHVIIGNKSLALIAVLAIIAAVWSWWGRPTADELPLVVMMDSSHPFRIYDEETIAANGTNADVISDILLDLPIRRQKEAVGPDWHRDEEILRFHPDLIVIHYSSFRQEDRRHSEPRLRLKLLINFFADSETKFLIYSRRPEAMLRAQVDELLRDLDEQHPGLLERMHVFGVIDYGPPKWRDPVTASHLKLRVKEILGFD